MQIFLCVSSSEPLQAARAQPLGIRRGSACFCPPRTTCAWVKSDRGNRNGRSHPCPGCRAHGQRVRDASRDLNITDHAGSGRFRGPPCHCDRVSKKCFLRVWDACPSSLTCTSLGAGSPIPVHSSPRKSAADCSDYPECTLGKRTVFGRRQFNPCRIGFESASG